jgi:hypothetical protein
MENEVREIERQVGGRTIKGTVTLEKGAWGVVKYEYFYPELAELGAKLKSGDITKIAAHFGVSQPYVSSVLAGKRINKTIIEAAEKLAKLYDEINTEFEECFGKEE